MNTLACFQLPNNVTKGNPTPREEDSIILEKMYQHTILAIPCLRPLAQIIGYMQLFYFQEATQAKEVQLRATLLAPQTKPLPVLKFKSTDNTKDDHVRIQIIL